MGILVIPFSLQPAFPRALGGDRRLSALPPLIGFLGNCGGAVPAITAQFCAKKRVAPHEGHNLILAAAFCFMDIFLDIDKKIA
jgi:hypothetical protein